MQQTSVTFLHTDHLRKLSFAYFLHNLLAGANLDDDAGFEVIDKGCCGVGRNNGQITCLPLQQPCTNRTKYLFWDAFHPTEAANIMLAKTSYSSRTHSFTYPINIQQLAQL